MTAVARENLWSSEEGEEKKAGEEEKEDSLQLKSSTLE